MDRQNRTGVLSVVGRLFYVSMSFMSVCAVYVLLIYMPVTTCVSFRHDHPSHTPTWHMHIPATYSQCLHHAAYLHLLLLLFSTCLAHMASCAPFSLTLCLLCFLGWWCGILHCRLTGIPVWGLRRVRPSSASLLVFSDSVPSSAFMLVFCQALLCLPALSPAHMPVLFGYVPALILCATMGSHSDKALLPPFSHTASW